MNRLAPTITGLTAAVTFAVLYSICALAFALFPEPTLEFFNAWFHGLDLSLLKPAGGIVFTLGTFVYGLLAVAGTAFFTGFLFAVTYNVLSRPVASA